MKYIGPFALMNMSLFLFGCGSGNNSSGSGGGAGTETRPSIYAFQTDVTLRQLDLKSEAGNFGTICGNAFSTYSSSVSCTHFYPFLGKSSTNGFKSFISANGLDATAIVKLVDGTTTIADSLQELIDNGPILKGVNTWSGWSDSYWYSGVANDGSAGNNCQDYSDDTSSNSISIGTNNSSFSWTSRVPVCDYYDDYKYICLCN